MNYGRILEQFDSEISPSYIVTCNPALHYPGVSELHVASTSKNLTYNIHKYHFTRYHNCLKCVIQASWQILVPLFTIGIPGLN